MSTGSDQIYSTLEALPQQSRDQTHGCEKPLPTDLGKQGAADYGKQYIGDDGGIELTKNQDFYPHYGDDHCVKVR